MAEWPRLRDHRWIAGPVLFLVLCSSVVRSVRSSQSGFIKYFFVNENLLRFVTHDYGDAYGSGHLYPRGSALLMFVAAAAPWSLLGLWLAFSRWRAVRDACQADRQAGFLFLSFAAGTLFWCLARQLLFTYVLPMVPLFAAWLVWVMRGGTARKRLLTLATALVAVMAVASVACVPFLQNVKTTREIVRMARKYSGDVFISREPLIFERKTPYSACSTRGDGWFLILKSRCWKASGVWRQVAFGLVVSQRGRKKELTGLAPGCWSELATAASNGRWAVRL
jgi:hypothetical protein